MIRLRLNLSLRKRNFSKLVNSVSLKISEYGDPIKVLYKTESNLNAKLKSNEVLIKYLASPIHNSDINYIQGRYPIKPQLPKTCGSEGYAQVIDAGSSSILKQGDYVCDLKLDTGTWTTYKIITDKELIKYKISLIPEIGAISVANPCSAYRMLKDFRNLSNGNVFIQNGGTSAVAIYATQLGKLWGLTSISIIRSRSTQEQTMAVKDLLQKEYGATFVLTEEEIKTELPKIINQTGPPQLGLDCIGGKAVGSLLKVLDKSGVLVTYGIMSMLQMQIPASPLIFSDLQIRGFWLKPWIIERRGSKILEAMFNDINNFFHEGILKPSPFLTFDFENQWKDAIDKSVLLGQPTQDGFHRKNILVMNS